MSAGAGRSVVGVTGATGMLGQALVRCLVREGRHVVALCRDPDAALRNLGAGPELIAGDLTRRETLDEFVGRVDVCIHLAAQVEHAPAAVYEQVNVEGTRNLCRAILRANPRCRLVFCSSIAVLRLDEMRTAYSSSKQRAEAVVRKLMSTRGLSATFVYPGMIFGPHDTKFLPRLVRGLRARRVPLVSGGESRGPFIYVDDLCDLFCAVADSERAAGRSYLGIQQTSLGMHDFIRCVAKQCGGAVPSLVVPRRLLLAAALLLEGAFALLRIRSAPPLSRRVVDVLTLSYRPASFDEERRLGWSPRTSMEEAVAASLRGLGSSRAA